MARLIKHHLMVVCFMLGMTLMAALLASVGFGAGTAFAQSSDAAQAPLESSEKVTPAQSVDAVSSVNAPAEAQVDLTDPAIQAAYDKIEAAKAAQAEANAELAAALNTQLARPEGGASEPEKTSIIPSDPQQIKVFVASIGEKILGWLTSIPFLAQIGAIALAIFASPIIAGQVRKRVFLFRDKPEIGVKLHLVRDYIYRSNVFLRAIFNVGLLALFAVILKNIPMAGQDWLVKLAQGLAVVFLLYKAIATFAPNDLIRKIATWTLIPLAVLAVFGRFDDLITGLNNMKFGEGEGALSAMTLVKLAIFGAIFFKLGNFSNVKGQDVIRAQESLDVTTREVVAKIFQIVLFGVVIAAIFTAAGISLGGLVVMLSALSLGIGLGLQPIAANFVSGMFILFDRSVKVGDFVNMEDDKFGRVKAINMRSATLATADGKDIIVPNTAFTETAYENWTHDNNLQRYEVDFSVSYDTDLDAVVKIVGDAVAKHPDVLDGKEFPSVEFRSFGDSGINMGVEFWCEGVDDGPNKFTSDVGFIIWRTLKDNKISIPFPQREVRML